MAELVPGMHRPLNWTLSGARHVFHGSLTLEITPRRNFASGRRGQKAYKIAGIFPVQIFSRSAPRLGWLASERVKHRSGFVESLLRSYL